MIQPFPGICLRDKVNHEVSLLHPVSLTVELKASQSGFAVISLSVVTYS